MYLHHFYLKQTVCSFILVFIYSVYSYRYITKQYLIIILVFLLRINFLQLIYHICKPTVFYLIVNLAKFFYKLLPCVLICNISGGNKQKEQTPTDYCSCKLYNISFIIIYDENFQYCPYKDISDPISKDKLLVVKIFCKKL